jgi:hypothetical protein
MGTDAGLPQGNKDLGMWERRWAPYDEATYQAALAFVDPADVIVDIGAGDLRLARRAADIASKVYALELHETVLEKAVAAGPLPDNLVILRGDARYHSFPSGVTCGILLMRHCLHFQSYASKLRDVGAKRLITNARWGFGVELVALQATRRQYHQLKLGWYACWCGAVGFKPGEVKKLTPEVDVTTFEVVDCPECKVQ